MYVPKSDKESDCVRLFFIGQVLATVTDGSRFKTRVHAGNFSLDGTDFNLIIIPDGAFSEATAAMCIPAWTVKTAKEAEKTSMLTEARQIEVVVPQEKVHTRQITIILSIKIQVNSLIGH